MKLSKLFVSVSLAITASQYASAASGPALDVTRIVDQNSTGKATSCIIMNDSMQGSPNENALSSYITLKNLSNNQNATFGAILDASSICLTGLDFGTKYEVTLRKGLKATDSHSIIQNDITKTFTTVDQSSYISFLSGNIISANAKDKKVAVESVNYEKFRVSLYKISEKDLASYNSPEFSELKYKWNILSHISQHGEFVGSKDYQLKDSLNKKQITLVDLRDIVNEPKVGSYVVLITSVDVPECDSKGTCIDFFDQDYSDKNLILAKSIIISDLGVTTYQKELGIDVAVRSLSNATPIKNAKATLYSSSNQVLETVSTDSEGYAHFSSKAVNGTNAQRPVLITVSKDNDFYNVDLRNNSLTLDDVSVSDNSNTNTNYRVYSYTNRTMVRPGETVYYQAIVRDKKLNAANLNAVKLMIYRPDGVLYKEETLKNPVSGAFDYEFTFSDKVNEGDWNFVLGFDKNDILSKTSVTVENFIPSSIETEISSSNQLLTSNDKIKTYVKFIYGAPAPDVFVNGWMDVRPDSHPFEKYKDYYFGPAEDEAMDLNYSIYVEDENLKKTDTSGNFYFALNNLENKSYPQKAKLNLSITDPNSKILQKVKNFKVAFQGYIPGFKASFDKNDPHKSNFGVILADQNGNLQSGTVQYEIFKRHFSYQFVYREGRWEYVENVYYTPVTSGVLDVSDDQSSKIVYNFEDGSYQAVLHYGDKETKSNFYTGFRADFDTSRPDRFELFTDKNAYKVGDTAYLEFDSFYDGYADLMIDSMDQNNLKHFSISKGHNKLPLEITKDFQTGSYVILSTYSGIEDKNVGARRTLGIAYVSLDNSDRVLKISSDLPNEIKPNSSVDIKIKVDNADGDTYVTASLVDEGILSINHQKSPSPDDYLYNSKKFYSRIYDAYAYIMNSIDKNSQGYGDDGEDNFAQTESLSNITKNLLSYYSKKVKVENGYATVHFDLNDISTSARFMVSGWSNDKVGSYDKTSYVRDNTVTRINMPYYFHTGDEIEGSLFVNNLTEKDNKYTFTVNCTGSIRCASNGELSVKATGSSVNPINVTALMEGEGFIEVNVKGDNYNFSTKKEYIVLNPLGKVNENHIVVLNSNEKRKLVLDNSYKNKTPATITFGSIPNVSIDKLVESIMNDSHFNVYDSAAAGLSALTVLKDLEKRNEYELDYKKELEKFISECVSSVQAKVTNYNTINEVFTDYKENMYAYAYASRFLIQADKSGFNVSKELLNKVKLNLINNQSYSESPNAAALIMYDLTQLGINVKSNAIYNFEQLINSDNTEIEALANYANIFGMYGDSERQKIALDRAKDFLNTLSRLLTVDRMKLSKADLGTHFATISKALPYYPNSLEHDTLEVIRAMLLAKENKGLETLYSYLNKNSYYSVPTKYLLIDMATTFKSPVTSQQTDVMENNVNVVNSSSKQTIATVSVDDYITKPAKNSNSSISVQKLFFDKKGNEIKPPIAINVNQEIIVIEKLIFRDGYHGDLSFLIKIPSNALLVNVLNSYDLKKLLPKSDIFINDNGYFVKGDSSIYMKKTTYASQNTYFAVAYLIKGAYKGKSVPLMLIGQTKQLANPNFMSYDSNLTITVK